MLECQEQLDDIIARLEHKEANKSIQSSDVSSESIDELEELSELLLEELKAADSLFNNLTRGSKLIDNYHLGSDTVVCSELHIIFELPYDIVIEYIPDKTLVHLRTTKQAWINEFSWVGPFQRGYYVNGRDFWSWFSGVLPKVNGEELILEDDESYKVICRGFRCHCRLLGQDGCTCRKTSIKMIFKSPDLVINVDVVPVIQLTSNEANRPGLRYFFPKWNRCFQFLPNFGPLSFHEVQKNYNRLLQKLLLLIRSRTFLTGEEHFYRFEGAIIKLFQNQPEKLQRPIFDILRKILKSLSKDFGSEYESVLNKLNTIRTDGYFSVELCEMFQT